MLCYAQLFAQGKGSHLKDSTINAIMGTCPSGKSFHPARVLKVFKRFAVMAVGVESDTWTQRLHGVSMGGLLCCHEEQLLDRLNWNCRGATTAAKGSSCRADTGANL
jgi:hypothetical protein